MNKYIMSSSIQANAVTDWIKERWEIMKQNGTPHQQSPDLTPEVINKTNEWIGKQLEQMQQNSIPHQQESLWKNFDLQQWLTDRFNDTLDGITKWFSDKWHSLIYNGQMKDTGQYGDGILFQLLVITAIIGVYLNIAGFKKTGNKMVLGSFLGAILVGVLLNGK